MTADWNRPHWEPTGRPASLFYFIPGQPPTEGLELSRSRHHVEGFPEELELSAHERSSSPEWFAGFFARSGLGSGMAEAFGGRVAEVESADRGTVLRGEFSDPEDLGYLRDSVGVISAVLEQGGLGVLDMFSCRWWSKDEWLGRFVARTGFDVGDFVRIISSDDELLHPGIWVHTRGMRKFGRPDLQIKHIPGPWPGDNPMIAAAGHLLNSLAVRLCLGGMIDDGNVLAIPGLERRCTFLLTPDDAESEACHFANEALEVVDLAEEGPSTDLNRLLEEMVADSD